MRFHLRIIAACLSLPFLMGCYALETSRRSDVDSIPKLTYVRRYGAEFQVKRTRYFEIYFSPKQEKIASKAAGEVDGIYERLSGWMNCQLITPYKIFLLPDRRSVYRATGEIRDIGGAVTNRKGTLFVVAQYYNSHVITHELVHIFLRRKLHDKPIPIWFNEGMAEYLSHPNPTSDYMIDFIREKLKDKRLYSWRELERNIMLRKPEVTYLEAMGSVIFISRRFGEGRLKELLELYGRRDYDKPFSGALSDVYHMSSSDLEKACMDFLRGRNHEDRDR
ncbi:hypothetical protein J7M22_17375 [Candidatus Poribacteria bacterium]|nr:hypothetical protein [Candidatus Poribacteria bacterium]